MKRVLWIMGGVLLVAVAVGALWCINRSRPPAPLDAEASVAMFQDAVTPLSVSITRYKIDQTKTFRKGPVSLRQERKQTVIDCGTHQAVEEVLTMGDYSISSREYHKDETIYICIADSQFSTPMTGDDFNARFAPVVLIDPSLYREISGTLRDGVYYLEFQGTNSPEGWLPNHPEVLSFAKGTATVSQEGTLLSCSYECRYMLGELEVSLIVTTSPDSISEAEDLTFDPSGYMHLDDAQMAKQLEVCCGYLMSANQFCSIYTDSIICQAFDDNRTQKILVSGTEGYEQGAEVTTTVSHTNTSKAGSESVTEKLELFSDGKYSISINGSEPSYDPQVDGDTMSDYCRDIMIGTVMLPRFIQTMKIEQDAGRITLRFEGNDSFADQIREDACTALYQDPQILTNQTQSYSTDTASFYLTFDHTTGIPLASGFEYVGIYTIDQLPYRLEYRADQQYTLLK